MSNYCWDVTHGDEPTSKSRCVDCLQARIAMLEAAIRQHREDALVSRKVVDRFDRPLYAVLQDHPNA